MEQKTFDHSKTEPDLKKPTSISRRDFLKGLGVTSVLMMLSLSRIGRWLMSAPERKIVKDVIKRELADNLELGELGKNRVEYFFLWPYARVWVVVNNLIAISKLNGLTFQKGRTYSLIDLLDLKKDYKGNFDPKKGYIFGLSLEDKRLITVESQGLSLMANAFARASALSPVKIEKWNTHTQIDPFTKYYFDPNTQIIYHPLYTHLGSDATVFYGEETILDFRFTPIENLSLKIKVMNLQGHELSLPNLPQTIIGYPKSLTMQLTTPLLVRVAFGVSNLTNYSIQMQPINREEGKRIRPGFTRQVYRTGGSRKSELISQEEVVAYYDDKGEFFPKIK